HRAEHEAEHRQLGNAGHDGRADERDGEGQRKHGHGSSSTWCTVYVTFITYAVREKLSSPKTMTTRTRRPRGSLTPEVILDAAEAVARDGSDALSMRAVAGRLGAAPMALYNHFATKEELVDALLDRVLSRFQPPPRTDDWAADLGAFARAHRRMLLEHPW